MFIPSNILVATDFSAFSDEAVARAFDLAAAGDGRVHVLHVFSLDEVSELERCAHDGLRKAEHAAREKLLQLAEPRRASGRLGEVIFRAGDPTSLITSEAAQLQADLVVVGTHGRHGLQTLRLGSVAGGVVNGAPCSVWIARGKP